MKIAVTAASGALGSAIINALMDEIEPQNIVAIARSPQHVKQRDIEIRRADYNSHEDFDKALKGVDAVLIVSGMDLPKKRIRQHFNIITAALSNEVKKVVYTSIIGDPKKTAFSPIISSNRQTEEDVKNAGMAWAIGRNSLYIEPDLEYIDNYVKEGGIENCAGEGLCTYTSRSELAEAYCRLLLNDDLCGNIYNLAGEGISQKQLAEFINQVYGTNLEYRSIPVDAYVAQRQKALGEFLGTVIGGIYEGIKDGAFDVTSDYQKVCGRPHKSTLEMIRDFYDSSHQE